MWYDLAQEYPALSGKVQKVIFRDKGKKILVLPDYQENAQLMPIIPVPLIKTLG